MRVGAISDWEWQGSFPETGGVLRALLIFGRAANSRLLKVIAPNGFLGCPILRHEQFLARGEKTRMDAQAWQRRRKFGREDHQRKLIKFQGRIAASSPV